MSIGLLNTGKYKKGNGAELMQYTEKQAQLKNLSEINSYINTRDNVFYTRLRDDIVKK